MTSIDLDLYITMLQLSIRCSCLMNQLSVLFPCFIVPEAYTDIIHAAQTLAKPELENIVSSAAVLLYTIRGR